MTAVRLRWCVACMATAALFAVGCASGDEPEASGQRENDQDVGEPEPPEPADRTNLRFGPRRTLVTVTPSPAGQRTSENALSIQELAAGDLTGDGLDDLVVTRVR